MRAPVCQACGVWTAEGEMVTFKKSDSDLLWEIETNIRVDIAVGQPPYYQWFCKKHTNF